MLFQAHSFGTGVLNGVFMLPESVFRHFAASWREGAKDPTVSQLQRDVHHALVLALVKRKVRTVQSKLQRNVIMTWSAAAHLWLLHAVIRMLSSPVLDHLMPLQ